LPRAQPQLACALKRRHALPRFYRRTEASMKNYRGLLERQTAEAREILRELLVGHLRAVGPSAACGADQPALTCAGAAAPAPGITSPTTPASITSGAATPSVSTRLGSGKISSTWRYSTPSARCSPLTSSPVPSRRPSRVSRQRGADTCSGRPQWSATCT